MMFSESVVYPLLIGLVVLFVIIVYQIQKIGKLEKSMEKMVGLSKMTTWENKKTGLYSEILGRFGLMPEYKSLAIIGSSSENFSLDMLGVKDDSVDYIEFKQKRHGKQKGRLTDGENHVKDLIDAKKVKYIIKDVVWPEEFEIKDREIKKKMKKIKD